MEHRLHMADIVLGARDEAANKDPCPQGSFILVLGKRKQIIKIYILVDGDKNGRKNKQD